MSIVGQTTTGNRFRVSRAYCHETAGNPSADKSASENGWMDFEQRSLQNKRRLQRDHFNHG